uniref:Uncharacterized protein n=1 Tax=Physcomitrium patens TaxID=3218 RepID=A0A2K1IY76_PHYPA|nr:hypothetical protein PHYPA_024042 [Physcomitrium patens]
MYERPDKCARLMLLDSSIPRTDVYDGGYHFAVNKWQHQHPGIGRGAPPAAIGNSTEFYNGCLPSLAGRWLQGQENTSSAHKKQLRQS